MTTTLAHCDAIDMALLNDWQRDFPLTDRPFMAIGEKYDIEEAEVLNRYAALQQQGAISRIGGVFGVGAGGSSMLCALAVPPDRLNEVAELVNRFDDVNHNYARMHHWNLWFVVTSPTQADRDGCVQTIEQLSGLRALRLPMRRAFRIDLGFDLQTGACQKTSHRRCPPVLAQDQALAAAMEYGMPLMAKPYQAWGQLSGRAPSAVMDTLSQWVDDGTLRRLGVIVRHHELGVQANAMTVFDVPDHELSHWGPRLAQQEGITLCYARQRDTGWPYNLYCMVHGRSEIETRLRIEAARHGAGLQGHEHAVLFSTQRFKQTGGRYFRASVLPATPVVPLPVLTESIQVAA
ncbi:MAG: Lrp/AsnC family transcriptional regulator [Aquabacterium sp.]